MPKLEEIGRRGKGRYPRRRIGSTGQIVPANWYFLDGNHVTATTADNATNAGQTVVYFSDIVRRWSLTDSMVRTLIRRVQWNGGVFEVGGWDTFGGQGGGRRIFIMGSTFLRDFSRALAKYPVKPITRSILAVQSVTRMVNDRSGTGLTVADFKATATEVVGLAAQFTDAARTLARTVEISFPTQMPKFVVEKAKRAVSTK